MSTSAWAAACALIAAAQILLLLLGLSSPRGSLLHLLGGGVLYIAASVPILSIVATILGLKGLRNGQTTKQRVVGLGAFLAGLLLCLGLFCLVQSAGALGLH